MKLIDLSHPLEHGQLNFPFDPKISVLVHNTVSSIGYNMSQVSMASHQGTHLDAPFHFYDDGKTIDQMRLDQFYGPASLVDLAPGGMLAPSTDLTVDMFEPHAAKFTPGARIIYRTGWDQKFGTPESKIKPCSDPALHSACRGLRASYASLPNKNSITQNRHGHSDPS